MIDYKLFEFAAPPCTHEDWYIRACQLVELGPGFTHRAHAAWEIGQPRKLIRVTLVRNPADWLLDFYYAIRERRSYINGIFEKLAILDFSTLDHFFDSYLEKAQGSVGALYNRYGADIVHRAEDIPAAFIELLDTLGVSHAARQHLSNLHPPSKHETGYSIPEWLKREIQKAEQEICDRYDY